MRSDWRRCGGGARKGAWSGAAVCLGSLGLGGGATVGLGRETLVPGGTLEETQHGGGTHWDWGGTLGSLGGHWAGDHPGSGRGRAEWGTGEIGGHRGQRGAGARGGTLGLGEGRWDGGKGEIPAGAPFPQGRRGVVGENPLLGTGSCHLDCLPRSIPAVMHRLWQLFPCPVSPLPPAPHQYPAPTNPWAWPHSTHTPQWGVPGV